MFAHGICVQAGLLKQTIALQKLLASIFNIFYFMDPDPIQLLTLRQLMNFLENMNWKKTCP